MMQKLYFQSNITLLELHNAAMQYGFEVGISNGKAFLPIEIIFEKQEYK